ncbi:MAG: CopG family transcriptional regulator [Thermoplasmata archaeon]|jgi:hypothetical protein
MSPKIPPSEQRTLHIPEEVARSLEARIKKSSFADLDAFVSFVLSRLMDETRDVPFSEDDEQRLRERLRSLGYID